MLTVAKVTTNLAAGYADYLEGKATATSLGDYYLKDGERVEAPGRWVAGASQVDCDPRRPVPGEVLRSLMAVRRPATGEQLRQAGAGGGTVAALDATFSPPKSVSAVWALADSRLREQIETAHEHAIDRAVDYAIERVRMVRERQSAETAAIHTRAFDVVATSWRHTTARSVDGAAPDPQLHSHVLLHAAVRRDGRLVAIDSRAWLLHRREVGAAYRTELAQGLLALGFEIERGTGRGRRYFELAGVPQRLIDRWSSRHRQVREAIENRLAQREVELEATIAAGGTQMEAVREQLAALQRSRSVSAAENRLAAITTRANKQPTTLRDLDHAWADIGSRARFTTRDVNRLHAGGPREIVGPTDGELAVAFAELQATFSDREARAIALERSAGLPVEQAVAGFERLWEQRELLRLADGHATTRAHRSAERDTIATAERIASDSTGAIPRELVEHELERLGAEIEAAGGTLTREQREAVQTACGDARFVLIEGHAGSGKSTTLRAVARAHQQAGRQIVVTSTAALAARRLARELADAGIGCRDFSTVGLAHAAENGTLELNAHTTVIHDEAALASTRELQSLTQLIEAGGGRLILVGDPRQSHAVGAAGLWPNLERIATETDAQARLSVNVRALDPDDRRDQDRFRAGQHELALSGYEARGRLQIAETRVGAEDHALDAAQHDREQGTRTVVIAQTSNDHLDELNARAQALRLAGGELGHDSVPLEGRPYSLHSGDEIQLRRTIIDAEHGAIRNGTSATVERIDAGRARLRLPNGRQLDLDREQLDRTQARLSYVQHPFPAQGITIDTTHLLVGEHVSREGSYVALTRARQRTEIHASIEQLPPDHDGHTIGALAEHLGREEPDLPSIAVPLAATAATDRGYDVEIERLAGEPIPTHITADEVAEVDRRRWPQRAAIEPSEHDLGYGWEL